MEKELVQIATEIGQLLQQHKLFLVTAESCTGGMVATILTSIPGSANWFERGFITYSDVAKHELLNVKSTILEQNGAVSSETAQAMAEGALHNSHSDVSIAVTGIAGPTGGSITKPVGTVYFALARTNSKTVTFVQYFEGDRTEIRQQAVKYILQQTINLISKND